MVTDLPNTDLPNTDLLPDRIAEGATPSWPNNGKAPLRIFFKMKNINIKDDRKVNVSARVG